jgi:hypothetical protein
VRHVAPDEPRRGATKKQIQPSETFQRASTIDVSQNSPPSKLKKKEKKKRTKRF